MNCHVMPTRQRSCAPGTGRTPQSLHSPLFTITSEAPSAYGMHKLRLICSMEKLELQSRHRVEELRNRSKETRPRKQCATALPARSPNQSLCAHLGTKQRSKDGHCES